MRFARVLRGAVVAVPVLLIAVGVNAQAQDTASFARATRVGQPALTSALARLLSRDVTDKVIIVLRNQFPGFPDTPGDSARRSITVAAAQRAIVRELSATHARDVRPVTVIDAIAATVSPEEAKRLAGNPAVAEVTPDLPIPLASAPAVKPDVPQGRPAPLPGACPAKKNRVQLDPEAVENIHAATQSGKNSAQALGYTGAGVKVAFIADGLDPNNPDFIRASGRHVFVDYKDFSGTGTYASTGGGEAFLDASSIAAQGRHVYNIAKFANVSRPCLIRILGAAPGASLVGLNVAGTSFVTYLSVFTEAIDYAVTVDHANVINESFGENPFPDTASLDLVELADNAAVKAGITVTVSSGDAGVTNTIASPASDPRVISVGASTTYRSYAQTAFGITGLPDTRLIKGWIDNNISGLSSGGFDQAGQTVDVVAPGDLNWALCSRSNKFFDCGGLPIQIEGGTSEAAPLTAGVAALVIQAYREGHHGRTPSPNVVKRIIISTAEDISAPADQQGAGLVDAYQAVLAARSYPGTTRTRAGHAVLASATQLNAVAARSAGEQFSDTLTNDGAGKVTVHLSSRTLSPYTTVSAKTLHLKGSSNFSTSVRFQVAPGRARLNVSLTLPGFINIGLISPSGDLAAYNLPQGDSSYGNAQVASPAPGTWTALVNVSPSNFGNSVSAQFLAQTATWKAFGMLSAGGSGGSSRRANAVTSVTLAPGTSRAISLRVSTPAQPGDQSGSIVLRSSASRPAFAAVTTIPVTLRSLAPVPSTFSGTLTGGNGRTPRTGQTAYYNIDVRSALPALNATVATANRSNSVFAELVSPAGIAESGASNELLQTVAGGKKRLTPQLGAQVHVIDPARGIWTLVVDFYNAVSGTAVLQPFKVSIDGAAQGISDSGLPDSAATRLAAGKPVKAEVTVTNRSAVPTEYFIDARLHAKASVKLVTQTTNKFRLPDFRDQVPTYLVPAFTTRLSARVTAAAPNLFEFAWAPGDPGLLSSTGKTSKVTVTAPDIAAGDWTIQPILRGPDGVKPVKSVAATASATAVTAKIDPAITDPTGDLWTQATAKNARFSPLIVAPGQTVTIPVVITPRGAPGTVVSGTVYVSAVSFNQRTLDNFFLTGTYPTTSDVAAFRYIYTIKG